MSARPVIKTSTMAPDMQVGSTLYTYSQDYIVAVAAEAVEGNACKVGLRKLDASVSSGYV